MSDAPPDVEYGRAVFATFQQALEEAESEAWGARVVLSIAAFFAPDDIPEELFRQPSQSYPPIPAELVADPDATDEAIGALAQLSLIDFDAAGRSFSIHRLVQAAARDALAAEAAAWANAALNALIAAFTVPESKTWPVCERLVSHVRAVASQVTTASHALAWLLGTAALYLQERAALAEVLPLYRRSLTIFERLAAADPSNAGWQSDLSVSHDRIGDVLFEQADIARALDSYQTSLAIRERLAAADPGNAGWQHDVTLSHVRVVVTAQNGNRAGALAAWRRGSGIMQRLEMLAPDNARSRRTGHGSRRGSPRWAVNAGWALRRCELWSGWTLPVSSQAARRLEHLGGVLVLGNIPQRLR
jgi:tetratricopeptide (TPR) repeat protein